MSLQNIYSWARKQPAKTAAVYNGNVVSYSAFAAAIDNTYRHLERLQLSDGNTAIVTVNNLLDCWTVVFALQALGLNTICAKSTTFAKNIGIKHADLVVTTTSDERQEPFELEPHRAIKAIQIPTPSYSVNGYSDYVSTHEAENPGGHILYTSGTTGIYKKLFLPGHLQTLRNKEISERNNYTGNKIVYCANFGLWTAAGYRIPLAVWHGGARVILDQRSDWPKYFLECGVTDSTMIPDMLERLLSSLEDSSPPRPLMNFRLAIGAGFMAHKSAETILSKLTDNLENLYGSTEINLGSLRSKVTNLEDLHWLAQSGDRTVEIVDETGSICPIGSEGQLRVRLTELDCSSYMDDSKATKTFFRDGCFYPGDMAVRRADGRIRILGRSVDVMNLKGQKIAVAPLEHKIQRILEVDGVCLFSGINDAGEEEVIVALESKQPPEHSALMQAGHVFAQFDQVRFALLQAFPRTQTGNSKVDRIALRKLVFPEGTST